LRDKKRDAAAVSELAAVKEHKKFFAPVLPKISSDAFRREFFGAQRRLVFEPQCRLTCPQRCRKAADKRLEISWGRIESRPHFILSQVGRAVQRKKVGAVPVGFAEKNARGLDFARSRMEMKACDRWLGCSLLLRPLIKKRLFFSADQVPAQDEVAAIPLQSFDQSPGRFRRRGRLNQFAGKINNVCVLHQHREFFVGVGVGGRIDRRMPRQSWLARQKAATGKKEKRKTKEEGGERKAERRRLGVHPSVPADQPFSTINSFADRAFSVAPTRRKRRRVR